MYSCHLFLLSSPSVRSDILECDGGGSDGIPVELLQILKDEAVKMMHIIFQKIGKTQQWSQDWKRSVFILIPKKGNAEE